MRRRVQWTLEIGAIVVVWGLLYVTVVGPVVWSTVLGFQTPREPDDVPCNNVCAGELPQTPRGWLGWGGGFLPAVGYAVGRQSCGGQSGVTE